MTSPATSSETTDSVNFQRMICNKKAKTVNSRTACPFSGAVKFVACKEVKVKKNPVNCNLIGGDKVLGQLGSLLISLEQKRKILTREAARKVFV